MQLEDILHFLDQGFGLLPDAACRPLSLEWPDDPGQAACLADEIYSRLDSENRKVFATFLTASALACGGSDGKLSIAAGLARPNETGLDLSWEQISSMNWTGIPLAAADQGQGRVVYALLGKGESLDANFTLDAHALLDKNAMQAITNAACLTGLRKPSDFFFWLPASQNIRITGSSMGLPVYLGFYLLQKGLKWPDLICTGQLTLEGKLLSVEKIAEKAAAAREAGFKALICPASSAVPLPGSPDLEVMAASDLDMARCLAETFVPGKGRTHLSFLYSLDNLETSPDLLCRADYNLLRYLEDKDRLLSRKVCGLVKENPDFCAGLASRLKELLKARSPELNKVYFLLNSIFPEHIVESIGAYSAETGLEICFSHIKVCNHTGKTQSLELWQSLAQKYLEDLEARGETSTRKFLTHIYFTVGRLQNTYAFTPEKARELTLPFQNLVAAAEQKFQARKSGNKHAVDEYLGRYYGTMAQHFGFCGPDYLETTLKYCRLAQQAFGGGNWKDLRSDWLRPFSYIFFARLDAQDLIQAESALEKYLDTRLFQADFHGFDKFQHYHLCRFLAESGQNRHEYVSWAADMFSDNSQNFWTREHPWQLWLLNMGRLVQDPELKKRFWQASLELCLNSFETIRIMGLMPLARLYSQSLESDDFFKKIFQTIISRSRGTNISREHFEPLWEAESNQGLALINQNPARFFPFSYR